MSLIPCTTCRRHVRSASECPFCAKAGRAPAVGLALALSAASLVACAKDPAPISPEGTVAVETTKPPANTTSELGATPSPTPAPQPTIATPPDPQPTAVATSAPSAPPPVVATATAKPQPPPPKPDRPMMARYGVAPNFRQ